MKDIGLNIIREKFLSFFESKEHLRLGSYSLVPKNDASLLLINAGMAPLKSYFTKQETPPKSRVTTCQKCIRTPDIERVGKTARHGTFFEMLGNFSFGDYFKREAISFAWEFLTEVMKISKDKLFISVYLDDDEAFDIWNKEIGVPFDRIKRFDKEDNFWELTTGPCGPCSEIYIDRGEGKGCLKDTCSFGCDCDRYVEVWNLVFTEFYKDENGNYSKLQNPNIDTGMGLERLAAIMQEVNNLFEVDTIKNIMLKVCEISNIKYGDDAKTDISLRVITDHIRSTVFMISDGIMPSNEGRGYVLRRLLRRAARHGKLIGIEGLFLADILDVVINESKTAYPELEEKREYIEKILKTEEKKFNETLSLGLNILNEYINDGDLSGEKAFRLYDTYGFPIDLTLEIAMEHGVSVNLEEFDVEMKKQRERAKAARAVDEGFSSGENSVSIPGNIKSEFVGYDCYTCESNILYFEKIRDGYNIVLDKTPFYGESGGQVGDTGKIYSNGFELEVFECVKNSDNIVIHKCTLLNGTPSDGLVTAQVNIENRMATMRNHTSTHILQKALRNVLGNHVMQLGSMVSPKYLRFDFSHFQALTKDELEQIENEVNSIISENLSVEIKEMGLDEAKKTGAVALFDEKYGDIVRVVKIGGYSMEFCGGTHLMKTSEALMFKIISEGGVASGVRRIEALTGRTALKHMEEYKKIAEETAGVFKVNTSMLTKKAIQINEDTKNLHREIETLKNKIAVDSVREYINNAVRIKDFDFISLRLDNQKIDDAKILADKIKEQNQKSVIVFAVVNDDKLTFLAMAGKEAVRMGVHCGNLIKETAKVAGGGGGGKPDMAQAGGKDLSKIDLALEEARKILSNI